MTAQTISPSRFSSHAKQATNVQPERVDNLHLPEQSTGPVPLQNERAAAEVLAERQSCSESTASPLFVP